MELTIVPSTWHRCTFLENKIHFEAATSVLQDWILQVVRDDMPITTHQGPFNVQSSFDLCDGDRLFANCVQL